MKKRKRLGSALRWLSILCSQISTARCSQHAAALTYLTLFSIVPILTLSGLVLASIPQLSKSSGQSIEIVLNHLVPSTAAQVRDYLEQFAIQAESLSTVGMLILGGSCLLIMQNVENTLNEIWEVNISRRWWKRLFNYLLILILAPISLATALILTSLIEPLTHYEIFDALEWLRSPSLKCLAIMLNAFAISSVYYLVPNAQVGWRSALFGGVLCAIILEILRYFSALVLSVSSFTVIYGVFAAVPIFLVWINLSWWVFLLCGVGVRVLNEGE